MALDDTATLVINTGNYFKAATSSPMPANLATITTPWENLGHTSLEDIFAMSSEGGEATVLGTLQNKALRTTYSPRTESMTFTLQQFDKASLKLFYGSNAPELPDGSIGVPINPTPTICAFMVVFVDGENIFAFYAPKAEVYRGDDLSLSDTESLAGLPLSVKPMIDGDNDWTYAVTPLGRVTNPA